MLARATYQLTSLIQITRPHNCLAAAMATLLGTHLASSATHLLSPSVMPAALVVWLIVAACHVVNDRRDVDVDSLNKPQRPIPSGRVSPHVADGLTLILSLAALGVAWTLGLWPMVIALASLILGVGYSYYLKSTVLLGNGVVGLLSGTTVIYGGLVVGDLRPAHGWASLLVFLFVFNREILKTIADQEGDAMVGVCTVATRLGTMASLRLFQILTIGSVAASVMPWFLHLAPDLYLYSIVCLSILPSMTIVATLSLRFTKSAVHLSLRLTKLLWFSTLLSLGVLK